MAICVDQSRAIGRLCAIAKATIPNDCAMLDVARRVPAHLVARLEAVSPQLRQFSQAMTQYVAAADAAEDEDQQGST